MYVRSVDIQTMFNALHSTKHALTLLHVAIFVKNA